MERGDLVIDLFYPPREQGFLALVDFEGAVIGPSVDHAFVVVDSAAKIDAHVKTVLSLELGLWYGGRSGRGADRGRGRCKSQKSSSLSVRSLQDLRGGGALVTFVVLILGQNPSYKFSNGVHISQII